MPTPRTPALGCGFYRSAAGTDPVREWLRALPRAVRLAVGTDISRVQWRWPVSRPLVGAFGGGLYEVRTSIDGDIYRVFFCIEGSTMVLLHGFQKKTQKTPQREIDTALVRKKEVEGS
jgi:phage-related protein